MNRKTTPAPKPKAKPRVKASAKDKAAKTEEPKASKPSLTGLVTPLDREALRMTIEIIAKSDIKGGDAQNILLLKRELMRAAGVDVTQAPPKA